MPSRCRLSFILAGLYAGFFLSTAANVADDSKPLSRLERIDDLRALEKQVQAVVAKVSPATVGLAIGPAQGSGVIIKDGYVLTAGHVSGQPSRNATITLPDGKKLKGKTLGRNNTIDSGLIKIGDEGNWPTVEIGKSSSLKKGQWVVTIGHPGGFRANRTPVVRVGRVLSVNAGVIRTDCTLVGGDSGGPLFDLDGKVVGIHSRIGPNISENFHVPVDTYLATWDRLAKGESWGGRLGEQPLTVSRGGKIVFEREEKLTRDDPKDGKREQAHFKVFEFKMSPGSDYTLDMIGGNRKRIFDPYLRIEDSRGKLVAEDDDGGGNLNSRIVFRPTREDTYKIVVTTCDPGQAGSFKLTIRQLDLKDQLAAGKVDIVQTFKLPRALAPLFVDKLTKGGVTLYASGTLFDGEGKPAPLKKVPFRWKNGGTEIATNDDGVARLVLSKENVKNLIVDVPRGHKVLVELTDGEGKPLPFKFNGESLAKEKVAGAGGKIVHETKGKLLESDPRDKLRSECPHQVQSLKVLAGETYTFDLESVEFDAFLRLEDSAGKQLADDDDSAGNLNPRIVYRAAKDDTLRIIVTTCEPGEAGSYRLTVRQAEARK